MKKPLSFHSLFAHYSSFVFLIALLMVGNYVWQQPAPEGLSPQGWHLLVLFVGTILGIILKPLPMGGMALLSISIGVLTKTFTLEQGLVGFSSHIVWLVVFAFFLALGFMKTGLGNRIAYFFVALLGKSTLGLAYGLTLTDFILSPWMPSTTARGAAVVLPIAKSIALQQGSSPDDGTARRMGSFLITVCSQINPITSALFVTAIACNPFIAEAVGGFGLVLDWPTWALATIVPGVINLVVLPWIIYKIYPPELKHPVHAREKAREQLKKLGRLSAQEGLMLGVFLCVLVMWIMGESWGISAATAALLGIVALLIVRVLVWEDIVRDKGAWDTLLWFGPLLMLANLLSKLGVISWFAAHMQSGASGLSWQVAFVTLCLLYYLAHYFFASVTAHVTALYVAFLTTLIAFGAPPMLSAIALAVLSSLSGSLTHYGTGPSPAFYASGYLPIGTWWGISVVTGLVNLLIWAFVGGVWWRFLGYW